MSTRDGYAVLVGMIPPTWKIDERDAISDAAAREWLRDRASDYLRVIAFGLDCDQQADRDAYGMLAADVGCVLDACAVAIENGQVPTRYECLDDPRERLSLCRHLARIVATRPDGVTGSFENGYDDLALRLVSLLAETQEAA